MKKGLAAYVGLPLGCLLLVAAALLGISALNYRGGWDWGLGALLTFVFAIFATLFGVGILSASLAEIGKTPAGGAPNAAARTSLAAGRALTWITRAIALAILGLLLYVVLQAVWPSVPNPFRLLHSSPPALPN